MVIGCKNRVIRLMCISEVNCGCNNRVAIWWCPQYCSNCFREISLRIDFYSQSSKLVILQFGGRMCKAIFLLVLQHDRHDCPLF